MIEKILMVFLLLSSICSLVYVLYLSKNKKTRCEYNSLSYNNISLELCQNAIETFVDERPLNEKIIKDMEYSDVVFLGIKEYTLDKKCSIVDNDCDKKIKIDLPDYDEILNI